MIPDIVPNIVNGQPAYASSGENFPKYSPHDGRLICHAVRSRAQDVTLAVDAAVRAQPGWASMPPVARGQLLHHVCNHLEARGDVLAAVVARETGKSVKDARGEVAGAIALGRFFAGEGQRLYGRTTTSGVVGRQAMTIRQPCGIAALIVAANTPIANLAWKIFPALICGNAAVLKAPEDTPGVGWLFTTLLHEIGLPPGVLNLVQGYGAEAGWALVQSPRIHLISFTGSTAVGQKIAAETATRLTKVSLELGGKNPLIVCADADIARAVHWICLSAFSNAGQRCAAASRIIIVESVYEEVKAALLAKVGILKVGGSDEDDFGPVINERQLQQMLHAVSDAQSRGGIILCGGNRLLGSSHAGGYYMAPTVIENLSPDDPLSLLELFGPITVLYKVRDDAEALALANHSPYGLTASVHTRDFDRAMRFTHAIRSGVVSVNGGTFGSEPHMPFGGLGLSGNGTREPGTEALDIYSELKTIYLNVSS